MEFSILWMEPIIIELFKSCQRLDVFRIFDDLYEIFYFGWTLIRAENFWALIPFVQWSNSGIIIVCLSVLNGWINQNKHLQVNLSGSREFASFLLTKKEYFTLFKFHNIVAADLGVVWLTDDRTKNRGQWLSLNSDFIECISVEITFVVSHRCSLYWVLKVYVVESFRLSCLLVCGNSKSRRWGWSLCLVQILGVAVWLVCRCYWRRSMMWTHWWQKLDHRYPDWAVLWFNGGVSMSPWCIGASPSSESLVD